MATLVEVKVPDIGDFKDVPVIEVLIKPGDAIKTEAALVTLESDKATMEVPSPVDGVVKEIKVNVGDKVSEGSLLLTVDDWAVLVADADLARRCLPELAQRGRLRGHQGVQHVMFPTWTPLDLS